MNHFPVLETQSIRIPLSDIYMEVDIRTYYQGETLKDKDVNAARIQTSEDDRDALRPFLESGLNTVAGCMLKRLKDLTWDIREEGGAETILLEFTPHLRIPVRDAEKATALLRKAISDYLSNHCLAGWLQIVRPDLAGIPLSHELPLLWQVTKFTAMLSGMVRRRATDLGGI